MEFAINLALFYNLLTSIFEASIRLNGMEVFQPKEKTNKQINLDVAFCSFFHSILTDCAVEE